MRRLVFCFIMLVFFSSFNNFSFQKKEYKYYCLTLRKSGTQFLRKYINILKNMNGHKGDFEYEITHITKNSSSSPFAVPKGAKTIFLIRDPRDMFISATHFIHNRLRKNNFPFKNKNLDIRFYYYWDDMPFDKRLLSLITREVPKDSLASIFLPQTPVGTMDLPSLFSDYSVQCNVIPYFLNTPNTLTVKFEDIIGPEGGGSLEGQRRVLFQIASFMDLDINEEMYQQIREQLFGDTFTFRKGQIGEWKTIYNEEHQKEFKKHYGNLLIQMGYEKDLNW